MDPVIFSPLCWGLYVCLDAQIGRKSASYHHRFHSLPRVRCTHWSEVEIRAIHYNDITHVMTSQITDRSTVYKLVKANNKDKHERSPLPAHLLGESTGDRWIPLTKGLYCSKHFHIITSSHVGLISALLDRSSQRPQRELPHFRIWINCIFTRPRNFTHNRTSDNSPHVFSTNAAPVTWKSRIRGNIFDTYYPPAATSCSYCSSIWWLQFPGHVSCSCERP